MKKSCLKLKSPGKECRKKCVAFGEDVSEQVFMADDWDRTPTDPAPKLSYRDVLELKEIQRSLPYANQPPDPLSKRQPSQFLSGVPIGLLPLLSDDQTYGPSKEPAKPPPPPPPPAPYWHMPPPGRSKTIRSNLADLSNGRPKPKFNFLPLLDTPPDPPEPKTFAEFEAQLEEELGLPSKPSAPPPSKEPSYFDIPVRSISPPGPSSSTNPNNISFKSLKLDTTILSPISCTPSKEPLTPPRFPQSYTQMHGSTQGSPSRSSSRLSALSDAPSDSECSSSAPPTPSPTFDEPFFAFEHELVARRRSLSPSPCQTKFPVQSPPRSKDIEPPSPILAPYCVSMKRRTKDDGARSGFVIVPLNG